MKHFKNIIGKAVVPVSLFVWALIVLSLPNICLSFTEDLSWAACIANVLLPVSLYAFALTLFRRPGLMVWYLFPLVFLSAFQMVLLYLYGHSVIAVDMFLNLVTTNVNEASELLDNLLPGIILVILVYVPMLIWAAFSAWKRQKLDLRTIVMLRKTALGALLVGFLPLPFTGNGYTPLNDLYPFNVFNNIFLAAQRIHATEHYADTSRGFSFKAGSTHHPGQREIYLLVIGETARAANFQIYGYPRPTTPRLSSMHNLFAFRKALTQSNTTHKSVPMLLSDISASNYDSIYHRKGIITAFKEAGFHTVFLSNQLPNHSFIDFFGEEADEWRFIKDTQGKEQRQPQTAGKDIHDGNLLPLLDEVLRHKRTKQLIVLHTYGSHFEYQKRYPQPMAYFQPDDAAEAQAANRTSLLNAYDNSLRYTDWLLAGIMQRIEATGAASALLYTSDHGENIFDDNRHIFLHASPVPSYFELHVPFLIWLSSRYTAIFPEKASILSNHINKEVSTSLSTFHTLLDMAGVSTPYLHVSHSVASRHYLPTSWLYLNDHNKAVPLGQIVKDKEDWQYFKEADM